MRKIFRMALLGQSEKNSLSNLPPDSAGPDGESTDTGNKESIPGSKLFPELNGIYLIFVGLAVTVVLLYLLRKMFYMLKGSRRRRRRRRVMAACSCRNRECTRLSCPW